jgi:hypothetical protein
MIGNKKNLNKFFKIGIILRIFSVQSAERKKKGRREGRKEGGKVERKEGRQKESYGN